MFPTDLKKKLKKKNKNLLTTKANKNRNFLSLRRTLLFDLEELNGGGTPKRGNFWNEKMKYTGTSPLKNSCFYCL